MDTREKEDSHFIKRAIELARKAMHSNLGGPFGAIIVRNGKIIGEGVNTVTSSNDPTAHAEINAIRNACKNANTFNLENATIFTSCEPCPMCLGAIYWARIGHVVFASNRLDAAKASFDDSVFYQEIRLPWKDRKVTFDQLSRDEGQLLFEEWNQKHDRVGY